MSGINQEMNEQIKKNKVTRLALSVDAGTETRIRQLVMMSMIEFIHKFLKNSVGAERYKKGW